MQERANKMRFRHTEKSLSAHMSLSVNFVLVLDGFSPKDPFSMHLQFLVFFFSADQKCVEVGVKFIAPNLCVLGELSGSLQTYLENVSKKLPSHLRRLSNKKSRFGTV